MEVLAQFLRSLHLPEARGPEGAPSPIRPPAAHLPLSKLLQKLPEVIDPKPFQTLGLLLLFRTTLLVLFPIRVHDQLLTYPKELLL